LENNERHEDVPSIEKTLDSQSNGHSVKLVNPKEYLNMKPLYYYSITISLYILVLILSVTVQDVTFVFGILGSTFGSFALWIAPGSFYVIALHKNNVKMTSRMDKFFYASAWGYIIFGSI